MADRLELCFRRALERLTDGRSPLLVAVSGGADSVALLYLLHRRVRNELPRLVVAHLDHGLRRGSNADRRFVERLAAELGHESISERRPVLKLARRDESPEEAARRVRRQFLLESARAAGCGLIVTGHHLDDQAETVLMRLTRGAGATALAGMARSGPGPFIRPLLGIERRELRAWLARREIPFREDPSNRDLRFDRNRTRRLLLPLLSERLNARAARHLVRAADRFREDAEHLDREAQAALTTCAVLRSAGRVSLDVPSMRRLPSVVASRVARLALIEAGVDARRLAAHHIEAIVDLAMGGSGRSSDQPTGFRAKRTKSRILIESA